MIENNCMVPVRDEIASKSRKAMKICGKPARLRVKWPTRQIGQRVELVDVAVCGEHAARNATTKFVENVPPECFTDDEVMILARAGMYVQGRGLKTLGGRMHNFLKKLKRKK